MTASTPLATPEWLASRLDDPSLRVLDATVWLTLDPAGGDVTIESGAKTWAESHIPGSGFADLIELSDPGSPLRLMLPSESASRPGCRSSASGRARAWSPTTARRGCGRPGCGGCCASSGSTP